MSKSVNPAVIGGFTLGAVLLLVAALLIFGAGKFGADRIRFVVFFESSLNGLEIGAPVKMQGVNIGQVVEIALHFDNKSGVLYKPVVLEIERSLLTGTGATALPAELEHEHLKESRDRLVASGMRARLETQSLLTGLLYVDFNFHPNRPPVFTGLEYKGLLEFPSVLATADELRSTAEEFARALRALPLDEIVQDLAGSLREIRTMLASDDMKQSREALLATLRSLEQSSQTLNSNLAPLMKSADRTVVDTSALVRDTHLLVSELQRQMPQLLSNTDKTLLAAISALNRAEGSLQKMGDAVGPDSALTDTLDAMRQASRSIRDLTDYLERHPEAVLSGKQQ
ncbi:MAG: MCE family protein [Methylomonas sp.]|nr:MCE family protein [Methylomonas sp.]PPD21945.1 MAG: mammalian cell entry protein [Methylomonas sp.]PPD23425.1 MAG: mammalian cell entry protein [Methylomonas sp.]PPD30095.1 MAG: mammalian cell entry protein [Methylomonas sp.]PPD39117.1 MAG: mammalian cell entry protein [Methylomonas sp.]